MQAHLTTPPYLFITCTHGNEPIGYQVMEALAQSNELESAFDWVVGNPRAMKQEKRYTNFDLNRAAPGNPFSLAYEKRRAWHLLRQAQKYPFVIDLHQTLSNDRIVIILPNMTRKHLALASLFPIENILYWPSSNPDTKTGPLVRFVECGLEIECGVKNGLDKTKEHLVHILESFLREYRNLQLDRLDMPLEKLRGKNIYRVYDHIQADDGIDSSFQDFIPFTNHHGTFIPLLFGRHAGLLGYKMRQLHPQEVLTLADRNSTQSK